MAALLEYIHLHVNASFYNLKTWINSVNTRSLFYFAISLNGSKAGFKLYVEYDIIIYPIFTMLSIF